MNWMQVHTQSYYRQDTSDCNICDASRPLLVNCTGVSALDRPFRAYRPQGRRDYYLMYLVHGELEVQSGLSRYTLTPGDLLLYPPGELYAYQLTTENRMVYLWIHFTGADAEQLLRERNLTPGMRYHIPDTNAVDDDFDGIQRLFITRPAFFLEEAAARLDILLLHIARSVQTPENARLPERLQESLNYLNRRYADPLHLETLAGMEYLSVSRYSALFRQIMGCSPQQYLINLRLSNAHKLLLSTDLSIAEIARSVGYDDALYFSRLFRRHLGLSPRDVRNSIKNKSL